MADRVRGLLLEAGGRDNYAWIHVPVGYLYCIGNPRTDWLYQTEPDAGLNGRVLRYPRGKVLGGSSSINGMIYMRGQSRDYDGWAAQLNDEAWRWDACLPFFKQHEDHWRGGDALHAIRIVYRVRIVGGALRDEADGSTDAAGWFTHEEAGRLRLGELSRSMVGRPLDEG